MADAEEWVDPEAIEASGDIIAAECAHVSTMVLPGEQLSWGLLGDSWAQVTAADAPGAELRQHLRARGRSPAGSKAVLVERLIRCLEAVRAALLGEGSSEA